MEDFSSNVGILNNFEDIFREKRRPYKNYVDFWGHSENGCFDKKSEDFSKITRLYEDIEAFLKCCKPF
jgi:hypothetical protein